MNLATGKKRRKKKKDEGEVSHYFAHYCMSSKIKKLPSLKHTAFASNNGCSIVPPCGKRDTKTVAAKLSALEDCIQCANGHSR